ncbi:cation:proton antiporter subunit C [Lachnospiraceae bacterium NSJ-143]|nr:cation:proton antiporter subunit C [Lachnospiraceae bacterium NSJ-143]
MKLLTTNHFEAAAIILFGIGFMNMLLQDNLIKKFIGLNIMDTAIYLYLVSYGYVAGRSAPIADAARAASMEDFINPIPSGLVLTGIVVSVSVTAFSLALVQRLYKKYGTLSFDEVLRKLRDGEAKTYDSDS